MSIELEQTTIHEQLKRIAAYRGYTLKALGDEVNKRYGTKYTQQSFSRKLTSGAVRWDELKRLGAILNFDVRLDLRE